MEITWLSIALGIGLILFALYRLWKLFQQIQKKSRSETWQPTTAEVLSKNVAKRVSSRSGVAYYPEIEYRYVVMGQPYENKHRLLRSNSEQKALETLENMGKTIAVRYDPNQPKDHISEYEEVNYRDLMMLVIALVVAGIILYPYLI